MIHGGARAPAVRGPRPLATLRGGPWRHPVDTRLRFSVGTSPAVRRRQQEAAASPAAAPQAGPAPYRRPSELAPVVFEKDQNVAVVLYGVPPGLVLRVYEYPPEPDGTVPLHGQWELEDDPQGGGRRDRYA